MSDFPSAGQQEALEHSPENHAKKVNAYVWNSGGGVWERMTQPGASSSSLAKATDAYGIQAISDDGTYKYFFFEADNGDYYILRKTLATNVFEYTKGTGGYAAVYVDSTHGPSGTPTWADRGATF